MTATQYPCPLITILLASMGESIYDEAPFKLLAMAASAETTETLFIRGNMKNIFTEHPHSINETYLQHMKFAAIFGFNMLIGGCACLIHAIFPFLFPKTGSDYLLKMTFFFIERAPQSEARIVELSQVIEKKLKTLNG